LRQTLAQNVAISHTAFLLIAAQVIFAVNFVKSLRTGRVASPNPWQAATLEWETSSPPPHGNFAELPTVHRWAYEYAVEGQGADYIPQAAPLQKAARA
jgi:cytochrome c oxidase subunit 1